MRLEAWRSRALGRTELSRAVSLEEDIGEDDDKLNLTFRRESSASIDLKMSTLISDVADKKKPA